MPENQGALVSAFDEVIGQRAPADIARAVARFVASYLASRGIPVEVPAAIVVPAGLGSDAHVGADVAAIRSADGWDIVGATVVLPGEPAGSIALGFYPLANGSGMVTASSAEAPVAIDSVVAQLDPAGAAAFGSALRVAVAAAMLAVSDLASQDALSYLAELKASRVGRWAGQAIKHEVVDIATARDVGRLHGLHAIELGLSSNQARAATVLSLIESSQSCSAALLTSRRFAVERRDAEALHLIAQCRDLADALGDAGGQGVGLRAALYRTALVRHT